MTDPNTAEAELLASHVRPFGVRALNPEERPCAVCGVGVSSGELVEFDSQIVDRTRRIVLHEGTITFRTCPDCTERHRLADGLLWTQPAVQRQIGSPSIGVHRLSLALDVLAAVGQPLPTHLSAEGMRRAISVLSPVARRWSSRFAPVVEEGALRTSCADSPWEWIGADGLADLRRAAAEWLAWSLPPVDHVSPTGACGACGIGSISAPRPARPWVEYRLHPSMLGGSGPRVLVVNLCQPCQRAFDDPLPTGSPVQTALLAHVDPDGRLRGANMAGDLELLGVVGWAVTGRTKPNRQPWAHLNPAAVRRLLEGHGSNDDGLADLLGRLVGGSES
ncbi:hypothetical protein [Agromyces sp. NPDC058064]|uniref:hypothetical protein n=1 Tax=Agromyces sp. NPDC058064 TaxID=3346322 RepID=UPI0036DF9F45